VAFEVVIVAGGGPTRWRTSATLVEDSTYFWRARATDDGALSGDWSATGQFFVTTVNAPPDTPFLLTPQNRTIISEIRPALIISNADDSDQDVLVYDWELATDETFSNIIDSGTDELPGGANNTTFVLSLDLSEDTEYCWRARADDGAATSEYSVACFLVSTVNDPPSVPTLSNPSDNGSTATLTPVFSWAPSSDPEGELVTYTIEVRDSSDQVVSTVSGVSGTVTSLNEALEDGESYTWRAQAEDLSGEQSAFSTPNEFQVELPQEPEPPPDTPDVVVNGGCSTSGGTGVAGFALLALGVAFVARRRRRR
jgi:MYXO-CTERM domain-containing protein